MGIADLFIKEGVINANFMMMSWWVTKKFIQAKKQKIFS